MDTFIELTDRRVRRPLLPVIGFAHYEDGGFRAEFPLLALFRSDYEERERMREYYRSLNFKELLAVCPMDGIDLTREPEYPREGTGGGRHD